MAAIKFDKDVYKKCEEAVFTLSGPYPLVKAEIVDPKQNIVQKGGYRESPGYFYIHKDAPIGMYTARVLGMRNEIIASDTMTVINEIAPPNPMIMTKLEFLHEVRKRGIIDYKDMPNLVTNPGDWWRSREPDDQVLCHTVGDLGYGKVVISDLSKNNPPTNESQLFFAKGKNFGIDSYTLSTDWARRQLDKLPFVTNPLCLWLNKIGIDNLSLEHVLYIFFLAIGARKAVEVVYNHMSKKEKIKADLTWDQALGIYFYFHGAIDSGNLKTGCGF